MEIRINEIDRQNLKDANQCHDAFLVESVLVPAAENGVIQHTVVPVEPYEKRYPPNEVDYSSYIDKVDQTVFFAYVDDELAGEIVIRQWWNKFAYIEDIAVVTKLRRCGVGRKLIERAIDWAKGNELPGIMLETQNNNVAACRFYERCGFELGGFDRHLYRALHPDTKEIALYWYLIL